MEVLINRKLDDFLTLEAMLMQQNIKADGEMIKGKIGSEVPLQA